MIARSPQLSAVPQEAVDISLALAVGYFWAAADQPRLATSPFLRAFQQGQGDACWNWLAERRNWNK